METLARRLSLRRPWWAGALMMFVMLALAQDARAGRYVDAPGMLWPLGGGSSYSIPLRPGVGDLDDDGHVDVVVTGTFSTLGIYRGRGDGTFEPPYTIPISAGGQFATIGDFDGDGHADIASSDLGGLGVRFGDGTGHGWTEVAFEFSDGTHAPTWLYTGDFDEDGRPDIALPCHQRLELFLSRPGRTFARSTLVADSLSLRVSCGRTADLDGDGHLDIVAECDAGAVLLYGNGDGTFASRLLRDTYGASRDIEAADVTGDGRPDLLTATGYAVLILPGLPGRSFGASIVYWTQDYTASALAVRDVTGDGVLDLLTSPGSPQAGITVHPGLGGGLFGPPLVSQLDLGFFPFLLTDLDEDERVDVVGLLETYENSVSGGLVASLGDGTGRFGTRTPIGTGSTRSPIARDLDRDGRPDLVALHYTSPGDVPVVWLSGSGRTFHAPVAPPLQAHPGQVELVGVEDVTSDSIPDIVQVVEHNQAVVHPGVGDGTFGGPVESSLSPDGADFHLLDVTGDGRLDLVATGWNSLRSYPGAADGTFASAIESPSVAGFWACDFGDLDDDGIPDVVVARPGPFGPYGDAIFDLAIAHGIGDGSFGAPVLVASIASFGFQGVSVADLDRDGRLDLATFDIGSNPYGVAEPWCGRVQTFRRLEDGSFVAWATTPWPTYAGWTHARACDLDRDGVTDLLTDPGYGPGFARGDGEGHLVQSGSWFAANGYVTGLVFADFDGDGRSDVVVSANDEAFLLLWGRDPVPPTVALLGPGALPALVPGGTATVRWSASDDVGVAAIDLFVSRHGTHGPFERVALGLPDTGEHAWTVTGPLSDSVAFKVVARDSAGNVAHAVSGERLRIVDAAAVEAVALPSRLALTSVAPNPARARLAVRFALPRAARVTLALHDLQGRRVATLLDGAREAGTHTVEWTPREAVRPGLYFLRLADGREHVVARLVVTR